MKSILELLEEDGLEPKYVACTNGGEYASPCPGCGGKDRFRSWPSQGNGGRWWCRQCDESGDLIQYLRNFRGMSFRDSCEFLDENPRAGCNRLQQVITKTHDWEPVAISPPPERWQMCAVTFLEQAERQLWSPAGREIRTWLNARGLKDKPIKRSRIGWNPKDIYHDRGAWGLEEKIINGKCSRIWIPAGLVIPSFRNGIIQRLFVRRWKQGNMDALPEGGGKYVLLPGSLGKVPMVLGEERRSFVIVESDLDAILLHQEASDIVTAVSMGSAVNRPDRETTPLLQRAEVILVALDTDAAGIRSAWNWWLETFPKAKRWPVPKGKDPGEAYKEGVDIRKWIVAGLPEDVLCDEVGTLRQDLTGIE